MRTRWLLVPVTLLGLALGAGCSAEVGAGPAGPSSAASAGPAPRPTPTAQATVPRLPPAPRSTSTPVLIPDPPPPPEPELDPVVEPIPDAQWNRMVRTGTWRPGCPAGRDDLRRVTLTHVDFEGEPQRGVLVLNVDVVDDVIDVFGDLLEAEFPIQQMRPVELYGGDVNTSLAANNTSAFNCRKPGQINAPEKESPHANGRAIDINPVQNPWRDPRCTCWSPSDEFATATSGPGVIRDGSLPVQLFEAKDWIWQDIKVPDYMHFDTGFPSRPWRT